MERASGEVLFVGAGASIAFGYPVTRALIYPLAHGLAEASTSPVGSAAVADWLELAHRARGDLLSHLASQWEEVCQGRKSTEGLPSVPEVDVIEMFSLMDVMIADGHSLGRQPQRSELDASRIALARSQAVGAMTLGLAALGGVARGKSTSGLSWPDTKAIPLKRAFLGKLLSAQAVVTTNWDLFTDGWLHERAGTDAQRVGTDCVVVDREGCPVASPSCGDRPPVLKLHGSLSWLDCPRCGRLFVNPDQAIAHLPLWKSDREQDTDWGTCLCGAWLNPLLVAPSYVKDYRNRHVRSIWDQALVEFARATTWTFVGYSLPPDDVHIRGLLRRALAMRERPPEVFVSLRGGECSQELARYRELFGGVTAVGPMRDWLGAQPAVAVAP